MSSAHWEVDSWQITGLVSWFSYATPYWVVTILLGATS